jgi:uncharacterized protein (DUF302 family)
MTTVGTAVDHPSRRLVVHLPRPYDEARELYETLVPEVDVARFGQMANWQATLELAEINAPQGFMRYYRVDVTAIMAGSPSFWKATEYLMGNHTIAERMFHHDPAAMLHAPLRTLVYADSDGDTKLAVDQPGLLFASYDNPLIKTVGEQLDHLLALLITTMDGDLPSELRYAAS